MFLLTSRANRIIDSARNRTYNWTHACALIGIWSIYEQTKHAETGLRGFRPSTVTNNVALWRSDAIDKLTEGTLNVITGDPGLRRRYNRSRIRYWIHTVRITLWGKYSVDKFTYPTNRGKSACGRKSFHSNFTFKC